MAGLSPPSSTAQKTKLDEKVDYSNLPCPLPYDEIHREATCSVLDTPLSLPLTVSLKPELFEGFRFDLNNKMNHKFSLTHSLSMGPTELRFPGQTEIIKIPTSGYEFGANFTDPKLLLIGKVMTDGTLNATVNCNLTDTLTIKTNAQLTNEQDRSQGVFNFHYKGSDYRTLLQLGSGSLYRASYIQHVTPKLSLGGEVFYIGQTNKMTGQQPTSGVVSAARYETDKMVASGQVSSTGVAMMNYVHKVSDKVSLAADFMYDAMSRDATASVGYDYVLRECRLRGKIDSNGTTSAHLEEQLPIAAGLRCILSAEVDHMKKDYKFGFGVKFENPPLIL